MNNLTIEASSTRVYSNEYTRRNLRSYKRYGLSYAQKRKLQSMPDGAARLVSAERSHKARLVRIFS